MIDRKIIEVALPRVPSGPVAHYTRIGTLCHFIPSGSRGWGSAWATPVQFLNDRMELSLGLDVLHAVAHKAHATTSKVRDALQNLLRSAGTSETDPFQMSFSGNPDELGQWRGYASNGLGCSVVTRVSALMKAADAAGWVIYDANKQAGFAAKILRRLRATTDDDTIVQTLIAAASFMKHDGFRDEKEFRVLKFPLLDQVKFREAGDRLVPYVDFLQGKPPLPIDRILIGPGWQLAGLKSAELARNHVVQGIQRLLTARGLHSTAIESSRIPYDPK